MSKVASTHIDTVASANQNGLHPKQGGVVSPQINGANLFSPQSQVGINPTISWSAPSTGAPTFYVVSVSSLTPDSSTATLLDPSPVANLQVAGNVTSLVVPPGVLVAGKTYFVKISAALHSNLNVASAPFERNLPADWSGRDQPAVQPVTCNSDVPEGPHAI